MPPATQNREKLPPPPKKREQARQTCLEKLIEVVRQKTFPSSCRWYRPSPPSLLTVGIYLWRESPHGTDPVRSTVSSHMTILPPITEPPLAITTANPMHPRSGAIFLRSGLLLEIERVLQQNGRQRPEISPNWRHFCEESTVRGSALWEEELCERTECMEFTLH